jgi:uncharacterized protein (DUF305 family)
MQMTRVLAVLLAVAAMALAGCASNGGAEPASEKFIDADVTFAQGVIPHYQQTIDMAKLADGRAESAEVKQLAADIEAAQGPEMETMTGWLEAWGQVVPGGDMSAMDHGDMSGDGMAGMMSQDDMDELEAASGAQFDRMFLTMMIEHHEGAIEMAKSEQADGENPDAIALAEKVEADQTAEIQEIQALLES